MMMWEHRRKDITWTTYAVWGDNIKVNVIETEWEVVDWIDVAQGRDKWRAVVNTVMTLPMAYSAGNSLSTGETVVM